MYDNQPIIFLCSSNYLLFIGCILLSGACTTVPGGTLGLDEVEVSMHMVLPVESESRYYITGTTDLTNVWKGKTEGVFLPRQHGASFWRRFDGELLLTAKPAGVPIEHGHPEFILLMETRDDVFLHPD